MKLQAVTQSVFESATEKYFRFLRARKPSAKEGQGVVSSDSGDESTENDTAVDLALDMAKERKARALKVMKERVASRPGKEDAFYVVDLCEIKARVAQWAAYLPNVKLHYAVKCNNDQRILETIARSGGNFDCATPNEIKQVLAIEGVGPERIIYAMACKWESHIAEAKELGVDLMTFDSEDELLKIKAIHPGSRLVLRLAVDDGSDSRSLSLKFGAQIIDVPGLLDLAKELQLEIVGISFHVGSGIYDASAYTRAIGIAHKAYQCALQRNFNIKTIDIGGGFPAIDPLHDGKRSIAFVNMTNIIKDALEVFPDHIEFIGEPGRYVVSSCQHLAVSIVGKRVLKSKVGKEIRSKYMYYLSDGMYGAFNGIMFDHVEVYPNRGPLRICSSSVDHTRTGKEDSHLSIVWGPTCDGIDVVIPDTILPEMHRGDWLYFGNMGAYSSVCSTTFNGFNKTHALYMEQ